MLSRLSQSDFKLSLENPKFHPFCLIAPQLVLYFKKQSRIPPDKTPEFCPKTWDPQKPDKTPIEGVWFICHSHSTPPNYE